MFRFIDCMSKGLPEKTIARSALEGLDYGAFIETIRHQLNLSTYKINQVTCRTTLDGQSSELDVDTTEALSHIFALPLHAKAVFYIVHNGNIIRGDGKAIGTGDDKMEYGQVDFSSKGPEWGARLFHHVATMKTTAVSDSAGEEAFKTGMKWARVRLVDSTLPSNPATSIYRSAFPQHDYDTFCYVVKDLLFQQYNITSITCVVQFEGRDVSIPILNDGSDVLSAIFQTPAYDTPTFFMTHDGGEVLSGATVPTSVGGAGCDQVPAMRFTPHPVAFTADEQAVYDAKMSEIGQGVRFTRHTVAFTADEQAVYDARMNEIGRAQDGDSISAGQVEFSHEGPEWTERMFRQLRIMQTTQAEKVEEVFGSGDITES